MSNETVTPIVITDAPEPTPTPVPFYKNRRLIKVAAITTAVVGVVAFVSAKVKSNNNEDESAGSYVDVESAPEA